MLRSLEVPTKLASLTTDNCDAILSQAADILLNGGLVAFPTETVYGLGANALNSEAAQKIYHAKGRPQDNPLIVHIQSIAEIDGVAVNIPPAAKTAMDTFWPGPLTLILPKNPCIPDAVTCGLPTVAVRMPNHPIALRLIRQAGIPIAAPSANSSGRPSPTKAAHVFTDMQGKVDLILDDGDCAVGLESTILDVTVTPPVILRPGGVTKKMLLTVFDEVAEAQPYTAQNGKPKAPGMKYTHYAPRAPLTVVDGTVTQITAEIINLSQNAALNGKTVGILATAETAPLYKSGFVVNVGSRENPEEIAANLFACLRAFDDASTPVDVIFAESLPDNGIGCATMNRLLKASGYHVIHEGEYHAHFCMYRKHL